MDGFETCRILKTDEELRRIPVIIVTALRSDPASRVRALGLGAEAFLSKPIDEAELAALVSSMARIRESENRLRAENERLAERTAELKRAYAEMESFAYSVSHDLRAPLRAIDAFSRFLIEDYHDALDGEGRRILGVIRSNTQKMEDLINGLLNLSRVSGGDLSTSLIDMRALADSIYHEAAPERAKESFEILIDPMPKVYGDSILIRQVWRNMISNAIKYSMESERKRIEIGGRDEGAECVYFVRDSGVGFDQEYAHKLFGLFQRLHAEPEFEGVGVGLAIVKRIVLRHRGRVWAESAGTGKGSTFFFSLPAREGGA
jgi:two-component system sensor histidine kinase/response regulator